MSPGCDQGDNEPVRGLKNLKVRPVTSTLRCFRGFGDLPRPGACRQEIRCGPGRTRTCDQRIMSPLLYQLSYGPVPSDGSMSTAATHG